MKRPHSQITSEYHSASSNTEINETSTPKKEEAKGAVSRYLNIVNESQIRNNQLSEKKYPEENFKKVTEGFRAKNMNLSPGSPPVETCTK